MSSDYTSATIQLFDGGEEHCVIILKPIELFPLSKIQEEKGIKKLKRSQFGWAKILVNNLYIPVVKVYDDSEEEDTDIDIDDEKCYYIEVPKELTRRTFADIDIDLIMNRNNFKLIENNGVSKKIPIVPSWVYALRRAHRQWTLEIANWWHKNRSKYADKPANMKSKRLMTQFCNRFMNFRSLEEGKRWFPHVIQQYEQFLKENKDPMEYFNNLLNPSEAMQKKAHVAPAAPRTIDVIRAEKKKAQEVTEKETEKAKKALAKEAAGIKKKETTPDVYDSDSDDDSDSENEDEDVKNKTKKAPVKKTMRDFDSDSDSESEEEKTTKKKTVATKSTKSSKKQIEVESESSESEEEKKVTVKKTTKPAVKKNTKTLRSFESDSEDSDSEDDKVTKKPLKRKTFESDSSDQEEVSKSKKTKKSKKA